MEILVNIDVPDLREGIAFYTRAPGLVLERLLFDGSVAELALGTTRVLLLEESAGSAATASTPLERDYARHWTPVHLDFVVADVDVAVRRAVAAGAKLEVPASTSNWGRIATLTDPFGHGFCFIEWRGRGYDEVADRASAP
jgi:uncharacterized glyoxalase superfamily protein PhnB